MDDLTPEEARQLWCGDILAALALYESVHFRAGLGRAKGPVSHRAARAFAQELILCDSVASARRHMLRHPRAAVAFYEVAHDVRDGLRAKPLSEVHSTSDGQHEPFLLVASAVLNSLGVGM